MFCVYGFQGGVRVKIRDHNSFPMRLNAAPYAWATSHSDKPAAGIGATEGPWVGALT